jgi:adenylate cyclase
VFCANAFRQGSGADTGFDELCDLCAAAGDQRSLAIGMAGWVLAHNMKGNNREASRLGGELVGLLESIGDSTLAVALIGQAVIVKHETAEMAEILRLAQRLIDLAGGDTTKGNLVAGSPLAAGTAFRGLARSCLGVQGWKDDIRQAIAMVRSFEALTFAGVVWFCYGIPITNGLLLPDTNTEHETVEALAIAEQSGDDLALDIARLVRAINLVYREGPQREAGLDRLAMLRERTVREQFSSAFLPVADICTARNKVLLGDIVGAIKLARIAVDAVFRSGAASNGMLQPLRYSWSRYWAGVLPPTCARHAQRSIGWRPCPPSRGTCYTRSGCCVLRRSMPRPWETTPAIGAIRIATGRVRRSWASRAT